MRNLHTKYDSIGFNMHMVTTVPTKLSVLLKIIFFISLNSTKITLKIQISEVCDFKAIYTHGPGLRCYIYNINTVVPLLRATPCCKAVLSLRGGLLYLN
jgi:hypothetical protein